MGYCLTGICNKWWLQARTAKLAIDSYSENTNTDSHTEAESQNTHWSPRGRGSSAADWRGPEKGFSREEESFLGNTYYERKIIRGFSAGKKNSPEKINIQESGDHKWRVQRPMEKEGGEMQRKQKTALVGEARRGPPTRGQPLPISSTVTSTKTWSSAQPPLSPPGSPKGSPQSQGKINMKMVISKPETRDLVTPTWDGEKVVGGWHTKNKTTWQHAAGRVRTSGGLPFCNHLKMRC